MPRGRQKTLGERPQAWPGTAHGASSRRPTLPPHRPLQSPIPAAHRPAPGQPAVAPGPGLSCPCLPAARGMPLGIAYSPSPTLARILWQALRRLVRCNPPSAPRARRPRRCAVSHIRRSRSRSAGLRLPSSMLRFSSLTTSLVVSRQQVESCRQGRGRTRGGYPGGPDWGSASATLCLRAELCPAAAGLQGLPL